MATLYELRSSYEKQLEEEQAIIDLRQQYKDLLTGSLTAAQQQYQQTAQTAATQASYDISGAYANYLKQQRSVAAQGRLETGYKEELGDVLKSQYGSAYQQARTTQATTAAKAYETYAKSAEQAYATQTKNKEWVDKLVQERATRAATFSDLYNQYRNITNAELLESTEYDPTTGKYPVFAIDEKTGEYKLTEFGKDWYAEGFVGKVAFTDNKGETRALSFEDWLKESGDEKQIEEWQKYAGEIMKDVAEIDYSKNEKGELTLPRYDETLGKETKLKTKGYIDTINKPTVDFNDDDFRLDWGKKKSVKLDEAYVGLENYANKLGVSENLTTVLKDYVKEHKTEIEHGNKNITEMINSFLQTSGSKQDFVNFLTKIGNWHGGDSEVRSIYDGIIDAINKASKTKYLGA